MSERLGRRTLWLASAIGCLFAYTLIIIGSAVFATKGTAAAGQATIAFIYLVGGSLSPGSDYSSMASTPLGSLPSEMLYTRSRSCPSV